MLFVAKIVIHLQNGKMQEPFLKKLYVYTSREEGKESKSEWRNSCERN